MMRSLLLIFLGLVFVYPSLETASAKKRFISSAEAPEARIQKLLTQFTTSTGLELGEYDLQKGPDECIDGEISVILLSDSFTLMIGAKPLVMNIGGSKDSEEIRGGCSVMMDSQFQEGKISSKITEICGGNIQTLETVDVTIQGNKVKYNRKKVSKKLNRTYFEFSCELKKSIVLSS